jgi:hypothetical protein
MARILISSCILIIVGALTLLFGCEFHTSSKNKRATKIPDDSTFSESHIHLFFGDDGCINEITTYRLSGGKRVRHGATIVFCHETGIRRMQEFQDGKLIGETVIGSTGGSSPILEHERVDFDAYSEQFIISEM